MRFCRTPRRRPGRPGRTAPDAHAGRLVPQGRGLDDAPAGVVAHRYGNGTARAPGAPLCAAGAGHLRRQPHRRRHRQDAGRAVARGAAAGTGPAALRGQPRLWRPARRAGAGRSRAAHRARGRRRAAVAGRHPADRRRAGPRCRRPGRDRGRRGYFAARRRPPESGHRQGPVAGRRRRRLRLRQRPADPVRPVARAGRPRPGAGRCGYRRSAQTARARRRRLPAGSRRVAACSKPASSPTAAAMALQGRRVVAFAGIGRPDKFFDPR